MVLDDVVHSCTVDPERFEVATARTVRWLDRCIAAHKSPEDPVHCGPQHQNLFGIVQGGLDVSEVSGLLSWVALWLGEFQLSSVLLYCYFYLIWMIGLDCHSSVQLAILPDKF